MGRLLTANGKRLCLGLADGAQAQSPGQYGLRSVAIGEDD